MASARLANRKRRRVNNLVTLFDQVVCKSIKLFQQDCAADERSLKLLDILWKSEGRWCCTVEKLVRQVKKLCGEVSSLKALQAQTQELLENESLRRTRAENCRDRLRRKLDAIREVLEGNDVDQARKYLENLDKSTMIENKSTHSLKFEHSAGSLLDTVNVSEYSDMDICEKATHKRTSKSRRVSSAGHATDLVHGPLRRSARLSKLRASTSKLTSSESPSEQVHHKRSPQSTSFSRLNRPHEFTSKPVLRMELCGYCGRRITFGRSALRCAVCRLVVHPDCKSQLIQTCVPPNNLRTPLACANGRTPATSPKRNGTTPITPYTRGIPTTPSSPILSRRFAPRSLDLSELCPKDQYPRIPALVIHCVTEVLARGMRTVGLYRVSGSEKQVRELFEKFFGKVTPVLARVDDIHVICGCLKMFLRSLKEPLVTYEQRPVLAAASESADPGDPEAIQQVVNVLDSLPAPNRDTLSYIMLHLKTIAQSPACQMGVENLAKVFGPTLVGYSCPEPQLMQTVTETRTQQAVLRLLFSVPDHIYSAIVTRHPDELDSNALVDEQSTYFSPVLTHPEPLPNQSALSLQLRKTPHRNLVMSARKRFFPNFSHRDSVHFS